MKGLFKRLSILTASLAMVFGVGLVNNEKKNAKADGESTYSYTFSAKTFTANETQNLGGVDWTLAGDGGHCGYDETKGHQFGSKNNPYKQMSLTTSGISGNISEIVVNTSGGSKVSATMSCSIGGTEFGTQKQKISATNTPYTFTDTTAISGEIVLSWAQTSSKALYVKSISVKYSTNTTAPSISINEGAQEIQPNENVTFTTTIKNVDPKPTVTWSTDTNDYGTIDQDGKFTATAEGVVTVTATMTVNGTDYSASVKVTIKTKVEPVISEVAISDLMTKTAADNTVIKVRGKVANLANTTYGNFDLVDVNDSTKKIYVYGATSDTTKLTLTDSENGYYTGTWQSGPNFKNACVADDIITMHAVLTVYKNAPQIQGVIVEVEKPAEAITLSETSLVMRSGENKTITAALEGLTGDVAWSSNNEDVAEVATDGTITTKAIGNATITATVGTITATCGVGVTEHSGLADDPFTVSDARIAIDADSDAEAYVKGYITAKSSLDTSYKNFDYVNIVDDVNETTNYLQFFRFKESKNQGFNEDYLSKGDLIVGCGTLKKFNSTYELDSGCYLVEFTPSPDNCTLSITQIATEYYKDDSGNFGYTFVDKKGNEFTTIDSKTWSSTYENVVMVDENTGEYVVMGTGSTTITLTITVNGTKYSTSIDIEVKETPAQVLFVRSVNAIGEITLDNYDSAETKKAIQDAKDYYDLIEDESVKELEEVKAAKAKLDSIVETTDAYTFVGDWNTLRELGDGSICGYLQGNHYDLLKELLDRYDQMTDAQRAIIDAEKDGDTTIGNTISYIKAYLNVHGDPTSTGNKTNQNGLALNSSNNTFFVLVIGILGLASIVGYYLANKKKMLTK